GDVHVVAGKHAGELVLVVAEEKQSALLVDQPKHDLEHAGGVGDVVDEVAELHDETVGLGGEGEGARVAVHVADHAQASVGWDGEGRHAAGSGSPDPGKVDGPGSPDPGNTVGVESPDPGNVPSGWSPDPGNNSRLLRGSGAPARGAASIPDKARSDNRTIRCNCNFASLLIGRR